MLSESQVDAYREHGYVIADFRLSESVLEDLRADQKRLVEREPRFRDLCPNLLAYDLRFLEIARTPEILDMVEQLIGPDFALWNSSLFSKPERDGQRTPWHQDGQYWPIRPLATCTVWIALDDSTPETGCLQVIPGSRHERRLRAHRSLAATGVTLTQELDPSEYDPSHAKTTCTFCMVLRRTTRRDLVAASRYASCRQRRTLTASLPAGRLQSWACSIMRSAHCTSYAV
jgi:hypothetical protein